MYSSLTLTCLCFIHAHAFLTPIEYKLEVRYQNLFCLLSPTGSCTCRLSINVYFIGELENYLKFSPEAHKTYFPSMHLNNIFFKNKMFSYKPYVANPWSCVDQPLYLPSSKTFFTQLLLFNQKPKTAYFIAK